MRSYLCLLLGAMLFLSLGCAATTDRGMQSPDTGNHIADEPRSRPPIDEDMVLELFRDGHERWWHVVSSRDMDEQPFDIDGNRYVYLSEDVDSKDEFYDYMGQSWTANWIDQFLAKTLIKEHGGRMARLDVDTHPLDVPESTSTRLVSESGNEKIFEVSIPCGEFCDHQPMVFRVTVRYVEEQGWRMHERLADIGTQ